MPEARENVSLRHVLDMQHPWEHDFTTREALEAVNMAARYSEAGYLSKDSPTIGWYEGKRLNLKMELPTTVIDIVDQLIEMVYPSGVYNEEETIGGQFIPPIPETTPERAYREHSEQFEKEYVAPVFREKPETLRITQLPSHEDLDQPWTVRAKEAEEQEQEDRKRRLASRRMYSESYGTFKKETDPVTHERGGYEESAGEYFETTLGEIPAEVIEAEEGEEDASGERYQTELIYCPECDAYYKPGAHSHGDDDPYDMIDILDEEEEYSGYGDDDEEDFY